MSVAAFDPLRILKTLDRHGVRFVVIGGMAGRLWGSTTVTNDLDICYARDRENLKALAAALGELRVKLRGVDRDLPFIADAKTLKMGDHITFTSIAGNLDILGTSAGSNGYESLSRNSSGVEVEGLLIRIAALDDLIAMKRAAARPKDLIEVEILSAVREEIERRSE